MRPIKRYVPVRPWPPEAIEKAIVLLFNDSEALEQTVNAQGEEHGRHHPEAFPAQYRLHHVAAGIRLDIEPLMRSARDYFDL